MSKEKIRLKDLLLKLKFEGYVKHESQAGRFHSELTHGKFSLELGYKETIVPSEEELDDTEFYYFISDSFSRLIPEAHKGFGVIIGQEMRKRSFWKTSYGNWEFPFIKKDGFIYFVKEEKV